MQNSFQAKLAVLVAMAIWGTIGLFVRHIGLPSSLIALSRGIIATIFLLLLIRRKGIRMDAYSIRKNLRLLLIAGACLGFNWILLFEAYRYTSVAVATICYYLAPVFIILASPFVFGEKLTRFKLGCVIAALIGVVLISGVSQGGPAGVSPLLGIAYGVSAAVLYAVIVLVSKHLKDISSFDVTIVELTVSALVLLPYVASTLDFPALTFTAKGLLLLVTVGVLHTGIPYALYFGALPLIPAQTAAMFSYVDPIVAILLSALVLGEPLGITGLIGALLVLGSTLLSELHR